MAEEWRAIGGFEGIYEVSDMGRVRKIGTTTGLGKLGICKLRPLPKTGYLQVMMQDTPTNARKAYVHQLVAAAFICERPVGKEVNHKNGIKSDNRAANVEWVTHRENQRHAVHVLGTLIPTIPCPKPGEQNPMAKLTDAEVKRIRWLYQHGLTQHLLARIYGMGQSHISSICARKTWKHLEPFEEPRSCTN